MQGLRTFTTAVGVLLAASLSGGAGGGDLREARDPSAAGSPPAGDTFVYVGSGAASGAGIHLFKLQTENLEVAQNITLVPLGLAAATPNPAFLEVDARRRFLFAANAIDEFEGKPTGAVTAFAIDRASGKLTLINQRASMGRRPCQLALDKSQQRLLVAHCGSGGVAVLPVGPDGRLGDATQAAPVSSSSNAANAANATKASKPTTPSGAASPASNGAGGSAAAAQARTNCLALDADNKFAFACDFAGDRVQGYRFDGARGALTPGDSAAAAVKAGTGPQDIVFRPDGKFAYVASAGSSTITVFGYDAQTGALRELQSVSSVPPYFDGTNAAAELAVHPSGKYLYVSNRGHNSVVLFAIASDGPLTYVEEQGTGGADPMHFGIEPSAKHLAIANHGSDTVLVCRIDAGNGRLKPSGVFASVPSPVFVRFLPPADAEP